MSFKELARQRYDNLDDDVVWDITPVTYSEFYDKDHGFVREPFFPKQDELAKAVLGDVAEEWPTEYFEAQAYWGKGSGKDRTAAKILLYAIYKLLCMKNPIQVLSAGSTDYVPSVGDKIEVGNVCVNSRLAKTVFFKYFKILLRACRNPKTGKNWFVEQGLNLRRDVHTRDIEFPKNITAYSLDSKEYTGEGLNLFLVIFDEIGGFEVNQAEALYDALVSTIRSRFPQFGKVLLLSYKRSDNDYMSVRYRKAKDEPRTFRSKAATWEVNLRRTKDDFIEDYTEDAEKAQRTYECEGSTSEGGFFRYKSRISYIFNSSDIENPIVGEPISVVNLNSLEFKESFQPVEQSMYFIHVDLAKGSQGGDACGLALGHYVLDMPVTLSDDYIKYLAAETGFKPEKLREREGVKKVGAVVDLALQIKAPPGGEVLFEEIRRFIKYLKTEHKFPIRLVTFDGWQSVDSIQQLRRAGVNAEEYSVDRTTDAYETLKTVIYEGLFKSYPHRIAVRELEDLIVVDLGRKDTSVVRYKVDHPAKSSSRMDEDGSDKGSKDVADAIAGCVYHCIKYGKSPFKFWSGSLPGTPPDQKEHPKPTPTTVQRYESEEIVRYGEKPPSWYKRRGV